ncbi:MAG TPA: CHAD domain-containing protein [Thermoplasmata archaeon]|nr:CHAD domain-containing protein [Thermoplasmata archaeon]
MPAHRAGSKPLKTRARSAGARARSSSVPFTLVIAASRIAETGRRDAARISVEPDPTPEQLHRFHQRLRKLRGAIRLASGLLSEAQAASALEVHRRLRRVARLVGEVRDFDVAIAHLSDPRLSASAEPPDSRLEATLGRMREEAHTGRALLGAFLRSEIDRGLFEEAEGTIRHAGGRLEGPKAWRACRAALDRARSRVGRAVKRARRHPDTDRMHRLRMELRRAHTLSDFVDSAVGRAEPTFPGRLGRLQRSLGTLHDLDLLLGGFEGSGYSVDDSPWLRREEKRRRALRKELLAQFRKRSTRASIDSLSA